AICQWPANMDLWERWEAIYSDVHNRRALVEARAFYDARRSAMDAGASLLWPAVEDLYTLMQMRAESGRTAFEREKQGSPVDPDVCEWPEAYFDDAIWFDKWPDGLLLRVMALDPSKGNDARRGDYSAYVMVGLDGRDIL